MKSYQVTTHPVIVDADSPEEARALAIPALVLVVEEMVTVDSILEDVMGKEDAAEFIKFLDSQKTS